MARGKQKRADYLLFNEFNLPIAVIEAKDNNHSLGAGVGLKTVDVPSSVVFWAICRGFLATRATGRN